MADTPAWNGEVERSIRSIPTTFAPLVQRQNGRPISDVLVVQIHHGVPIRRARMVRGIVANEARDGSTPFARSNSPRPADR